ncbi:MAG: hypothetical protein M1837_003021 [Sclerophora amabilis]|nr:MAG: hypothetical protein M1837_003021 [Sclerophora amabilis]
MSTTYREAWGLFQSEQPTLSSGAPHSPTSSNVKSADPRRFSIGSYDGTSATGSSSPPLITTMSRKQRSSASSTASSGRVSPVMPGRTARDTANPLSNQVSGANMAQELQRLRYDLHQLQYSSAPGTGPDPAEAAQVSEKLDLLTTAVYSDSLPPGSAGRSRSGSAVDANQQYGSLRCFDTCCNGKQFSNKSNLVRHQRERRGEAAKLRCSFCDAVFSRSSARNSHEAERRCRQS